MPFRRSSPSAGVHLLARCTGARRRILSLRYSEFFSASITLSIGVSSRNVYPRLPEDTPLMQRRPFLQLSLAALASSLMPLRMKAAEIAKLRELAAAKGLFFGTAVSERQLKRPEFTALLADQCSILVAENQMKWRATHPEQDRYDFAAASGRPIPRHHRLQV